MILGIGGWDWFAIGVYIAVMVVIGVYSARKVKDTTDFFMAGRRFGKPFMIFFAFGAGTGVLAAVLLLWTVPSHHGQSSARLGS